jgi:hypothetical protein
MIYCFSIQRLGAIVAVTKMIEFRIFTKELAMDSIRSLVLVIGLALLGGTPVLADVLLMEGIQSAPAVNTPHNGITMAQVRQQYGNPVSEHPAVGDPPITRWDYDDYSVFFENDLVLHSVVHRQAKN